MLIVKEKVITVPRTSATDTQKKWKIKKRRILGKSIMKETLKYNEIKGDKQLG